MEKDREMRVKKYDVKLPVNLKKGVYKLNKERNFDYQLNRVINWDGGRLEDVEKAASGIKNSDDWKRELIRLGDEALAEERIDNAIAYYRMSEFFKEDAQNHCNVGNGKLVLDTICDWIEQMNRNSKAE